MSTQESFHPNYNGLTHKNVDLHIGEFSVDATPLDSVRRVIYNSAWPTTLEGMLDPNTGTPKQRRIKEQIYPTDPIETIQSMERFHIDKFPIFAFGYRRSKRHLERGKVQTNYTLGGTDVASMVDFATRQTWRNEQVHRVGLKGNITAWVRLGLLLPFALTGTYAVVGIPLSLLVAGGILVNTISTLAQVAAIKSQQYVRARLTLAIDKALARGRPFDTTKYPNPLGLVYPKVIDAQPPQS